MTKLSRKLFDYKCVKLSERHWQAMAGESILAGSVFYNSKKRSYGNLHFLKNIRNSKTYLSTTIL